MLSIFGYTSKFTFYVDLHFQEQNQRDTACTRKLDKFYSTIRLMKMERTSWTYPLLCIWNWTNPVWPPDLNWLISSWLAKDWQGWCYQNLISNVFFCSGEIGYPVMVKASAGGGKFLLCASDPDFYLFFDLLNAWNFFVAFFCPHWQIYL